MVEKEDTPQPTPEPAHEPVRGIKHIFAATRYSAAGLACLLKQTAFILELCGAVGLFIVFALIGAQGVQFLVLALLFLLVFCVEALNTAIEMIVDELSPNRSEFARNTKDLGSLAVACTLLGTGLYATYVVIDNLLN